MGTFIAKLKQDSQRWYKLADQITNREYEEIHLNDTVIYDPNNTNSEQWFRVENFNQMQGFMPLLTSDIIVAELESLSSNQFVSRQVDFIAYYHEHKYYMQSFTRNSLMRKKWFSLNGEAVTYSDEDGILFINPIPNCIYDNQTNCLYFKDIAKAYGVLGDLKLDYKAATEPEVNSFLQSDIIQTEGFDVAGVGLSNRKRITSILSKYEQYGQEEKATLRQYIRDSVGNSLVFNEETQKFMIKSDTHLKLLLYGMQQRFYQPPLEVEVQVATSNTGISKIL